MSEILDQLQARLPESVQLEKIVLDNLHIEAISPFLLGQLNVDGKEFDVILVYRVIDEVSIFLKQIRLLRQEAAKLNLLPMIALKFIGPKLRQIAKEEGVNYLDLAGNLYFRQKNVYVERIVTWIPVKHITMGTKACKCWIPPSYDF